MDKKPSPRLLGAQVLKIASASNAVICTLAGSGWSLESRTAFGVIGI